DDNRRNRRLAGPRVESQLVKTLFEDPCVVPEPFDELGLFLDQAQRRQRRGRDGRGMRRREQQRPRAVNEIVDQRAAAGHVSALRGEGLGQRPDLNVHPSMQPKWSTVPRPCCPITPLACASSTIMMAPNSSARATRSG